ncbi:MAG TPA: hypothetical protein VEW46_17205 [Pyrinomonadaceae bacterium]|nr:hypothetical protein [Pyrinomonadaceae bacterium]
MRSKKPLSLILFYLPTIAFLFVSISLAQSQNPSPANTAKKQELTLADMLHLPGKIVAEGTNTEPVGGFKLISYRIEEVTLPKVMEFENYQRRKLKADKYHRIIVTGGPFRIGNESHYIWIDDTVIGWGSESTDVRSLTAIVFDPSVLREGATIYVSWGYTKSFMCQALPEKLKFKDAGRDNK